jgi:hypothetical protein
MLKDAFVEMRQQKMLGFLRKVLPGSTHGDVGGTYYNRFGSSKARGEWDKQAKSTQRLLTFAVENGVTQDYTGGLLTKLNGEKVRIGLSRKPAAAQEVNDFTSDGGISSASKLRVLQGWQS